MLQLSKRRHTDGTLHAIAAIFLFLGFMLGCLTLAWAEENRQHPSRALRIVCESGSFEPVRVENDPYLREEAVCNVNDSNGREIRVLIID